MKFLITFITNILLALLFFYNSTFLDGLNDDIEIAIIVSIIDYIFIFPISIVIGFVLYNKIFETSNYSLEELKEKYEFSFAYTIGIFILFILNIFFKFLSTDPINFLIITSLPALFIGMLLLSFF
ncbi:hypothetical protein JCM11957_10620 [Caminibacter profundus]